MLSHQSGDLHVKASYWIGKAFDVGDAFIKHFSLAIVLHVGLFTNTHPNHTIRRRVLMWNRILIIEYATVVVRIAIIMDII